VSASEKLKALANDEWPDPDFSRRQGAEAWAQVVAVVGAAEPFAVVSGSPDAPEVAERYALIATLAALEEALP
jgi:hypothetical protein